MRVSFYQIIIIAVVTFVVEEILREFIKEIQDRKSQKDAIVKEISKL